MKNANPTIRLLAYGLCLATILYNCKSKDVDSLTPFTYVFPGITPPKLPTVTTTAPVAVSVTAATVTSSTAAAAVSAGLAGLNAGSTTVPAVVTQAATDVNKAISTQAAAQLSASFTPEIINAMVTTGAIPADLKAQLATLSSNPALKAYLPTFTLPTVDGKAVGGRLGAVAAVTIVGALAAANATLDDDACKAAANTAYNTALTTLKADQAAQTAVINTAFTSLQTSITAESAPCKAGVPAKYTPLRSATQQAFTSGMANVEASRALLGEPIYTFIRLLYLAALSDANSLFTRLEAAEVSACDAVGVAKLARAQAARDGDLSKINGNYNAALGTLNAGLAKAVASCHNQGNGG